ncbi:UDP-glucose 4-epimerase GalE [Tropicimonas aquimaris]|uniref:UDP-glucose 4-epimerase n=1 Tax=Tropicimonas aquimaris TaxID=914152 RepID=A0ABW3IQL6_9RHOB
MEKQAVLVTGGAGYVGSHACMALSEAGFLPVCYDDLRRGNRWAVQWGPLIEAPLEDSAALASAMQSHSVAAVMHFAAYAYVAESMSDPSSYFRNNVSGSINVLDAMVASGVPNLVISSTCAIYGIPPALPIVEEMPAAPINPYGASKHIMEEIADWYAQTHGLRTCALRYFNAAGCDPSGAIGEWHDPEPHVFPLAIAAALDRNSQFSIFGTDYPTPDGTAVRDYVHVSDLAEAHVLALHRLLEGGDNLRCNLGTGQGTSVKEVLEAVASAAGRKPNVVMHPRRPGDPPELVADPSLAMQTLRWKPIRSDPLTIAEDAHRWYVRRLGERSLA